MVLLPVWLIAEFVCCRKCLGSVWPSGSPFFSTATTVAIQFTSLQGHAVVTDMKLLAWSETAPHDYFNIATTADDSMSCIMLSMTTYQGDTRAETALCGHYAFVSGLSMRVVYCIRKYVTWKSYLCCTYVWSGLLVGTYVYVSLFLLQFSV